MVTTKEVLAAAKAKSKKEAEWKAWVKAGEKKFDKEIKEREKQAKAKAKKAEKTAKARAAAKDKVISGIDKPRGALKSGSIAKGIAKAFRKATKPLPRRRVRIVKRRPIRRQPVKRFVRRAPTLTRRVPASVKELQSTPNLRSLLTPAEQAEVDSSNPALRRFNAMAILRRRLKVQRQTQDRTTPRVIQSTDPFNSSRVVKKVEVPREAWVM